MAREARWQQQQAEESETPSNSYDSVAREERLEEIKRRREKADRQGHTKLIFEALLHGQLDGIIRASNLPTRWYFQSIKAAMSACKAALRRAIFPQDSPTDVF